MHDAVPAACWLIDSSVEAILPKRPGLPAVDGPYVLHLVAGVSMLCCIAEIAMTIFGIVTLVRGKFTVSSRRVVTGAPAYLIGAILMATLPMVLAIGMVLGLVLTYQAVQAGNPPPGFAEGAKYGFIEVIVVGGILAVVVAISLAKGKPPEAFAPPPVFPPPGPPPEFPPADPNNPYASPYTSPGPQPPSPPGNR